MPRSFKNLQQKSEVEEAELAYFDCAYQVPVHLAQWLDGMLYEWKRYIDYLAEVDLLYKRGHIDVHDCNKRKQDIIPLHRGQLAAEYAQTFIADVESSKPPAPKRELKGVWYTRYTQHPLHKVIQTSDGVRREPPMIRRGKIERKWIPINDGLTREEPLPDTEASLEQKQRQQVFFRDFPGKIHTKLTKLSQKYQLSEHDIMAQILERAMVRHQTEREKNAAESTNPNRERYFKASKRWDDDHYKKLEADIRKEMDKDVI